MNCFFPSKSTSILNFFYPKSDKSDDKVQFIHTAMEKIGDFDGIKFGKIMSINDILVESENNPDSCFAKLACQKNSWIPHLFYPKSFQLALVYGTILNQYATHGVPALLELFPASDRYCFQCHVFSKFFLEQLEKSDFDPYLAKRILENFDTDYIKQTISLNSKCILTFRDDSHSVFKKMDLQKGFSEKLCCKFPKPG